MDRPNFTFRQAQAAFDVIDVAQRASDALLASLGGPRLPEIVRAQGCRFEANDDLDAFESVSVKAASPEHFETCVVALAILLADALQDGVSHGSLDGYAELAQEALSAGPKLQSAAIVRAFNTARDLGGLGILPPELPFSPVDCLTSETGPILAALCALARSMDDETRNEVAKADYGYETTKHRAALDEVLLREDCRFRDGEHWHPSEVVELIGHVPDQPGFLECTALLLANAIPTKDEMGWFDFRFENIGPAYFAFPTRGAAIVAGLRHLYESDDAFLWHFTRQYDPVLAPERMIPLVDFPSRAS